jgi:hypothetical protein
MRPRGENVEYDKLAQRLANLEREYLNLDKLAVNKDARIASLEAYLARCRAANVYDAEAHRKAGRVETLEAALKIALTDMEEMNYEMYVPNLDNPPPSRGMIAAREALGTTSETAAEQQERALVTCKHQGTKTRDPYGTYWCDICKGILTDEYAENRGGKP